MPALLAVALLLAVGLVPASPSLAQQAPPRNAPGAGERAAEAAADRVPGDGGTEVTWYLVLFRGVATVGVVVALATAALLFFENRFVFRPSAEPVEGWQPPGLGVEECTFPTRDGLRLYGWWHAGEGDDPGRRPVLLWCHGNAGNVTHRAEHLRMLAERGLAVFLFDYRGYGRSEGKPSERGLYMDGEAAYRYLTAERGIEPERIICLGRSLGGAVALHVAMRQKTAAVILESALEDVASIVRRKVRLLPLALFVRNRFDVLGRVRRLNVPLLVVHGSQDRAVPVEEGRAVYAAASSPKQIYLVEGAGHYDTYQVGGDEYYRTLREFCYGCIGRQGT
jgi:hypothetical protein